MKKISRATAVIIATCLATLPSIAFAADEISGADTAWIMTSTALVLMMTLPGLALFYGGLVRVKNVLSIFMQCFAIAGVVSILWVLFVYSLAFGDGGSANAWIGGFGKAFFAGIGRDAPFGTLPESVFSMFQLTFAIITPALIVGGFAERMRFSAMLAFSIIWLIVVYAPITHWVWGGGWLQQMGLLDFAGGTVVHITAGVSALVAALVLGRRSGFPKTPMPPHNLTLTVAGAGMLWVGWFGFNGGSALAANSDAGMAIFVTHLSASAGATMWMLMEWLKFGKPSTLGIVTGMVAGLGTITPASGFVGPMGGIVIGLLAGFICFNATQIIKQKLHIDDSLDVFPVHGIGGMLGTFLAGIFVSSQLGVFSGAGLAEGMTMAKQVGVQITGILATGFWAGVITWLTLKMLDAVMGIRVTAEDESQGLDIAEHEERGYII